MLHAEIIRNFQHATLKAGNGPGDKAMGFAESIQFATHAGAIAVDRAGYGQGTGPIVLDDIACSTADNRLTDCSSNEGTFNCDHRADAGVICVPPYTPGPGELPVTILIPLILMVLS